MTAPRIAYLTSQYPAPSHTFIRREVAAVRAAGLDVRTYSVQRPQAGLASALDRTAAAETFAVLGQSPVTYLRAHAAAALTRPTRYLATLALAWRHRVPGVRAALWSLFHFAEAIVLARQFERDGVGRVHNHFANSAATVGLLATRFAQLPWSLTLHGISEFDYPAGQLLADKIAAADFVACVSRFGMAQAMRLTAPAQWDKFAIVRCGIDPATLPPPAPPRPWGGAFHLIAVGRLSPEKGQAGLIDALAIVRARGLDVSLTLVGDGPEEAQLRARVAAAGLDDIVRFTGRLDERATLVEIAQADALVLPSFMEGLPVVLMEAMALGVPVIATRVAGIPELVRDGETGVLFDPADWAGLADAIARVAQGQALRERLALAGRMRVESEFIITRAVAPLLGLLQRGTPAA